MMLKILSWLCSAFAWWWLGWKGVVVIFIGYIIGATIIIHEARRKDPSWTLRG